MRRRARTDLCGGRSVTVVPTASLRDTSTDEVDYFRMADDPRAI